MSANAASQNPPTGTVPLPSLSGSQSYYETEALVPPDHRLVLEVPAEVPAGPVRLAIIYHRSQPTGSKGLKDLLLEMPDLGTDEDFARVQDLGRATEL